MAWAYSGVIYSTGSRMGIMCSNMRDDGDLQYGLCILSQQAS